MKPLELAKAIAVRAGDYLKREQSRPRSIQYKGAGKGNLVTDMDHASEAMIVKALRREFPDHAVVAEERGHEGKSDYRWFIDPIDGTTNYAHGFPIWTVTLALEVRGRLEVGVTYAPCLGELFWAERGKGAFRNGKRIRVTPCATVEQALLCTGFSYDLEVRRINLKYFAEFLMKAQAIRRVGAASLDLCWTAAGAFDGFWEMRLGPWDMAAGIVILEEAGAKVTNFEGGAVDVFHGDFLGANPVLHRKMIQVMKRVKVD
ncbi:MAG TPA: inositol monophosphatase family protein [Planctomycetota bacterium]